MFQHRLLKECVERKLLGDFRGATGAWRIRAETKLFAYRKKLREDLLGQVNKAGETVLLKLLWNQDFQSILEFLDPDSPAFVKDCGDRASWYDEGVKLIAATT